MRECPDAKTKGPSRGPQDDTSRGGLGAMILRAMGDAGLGSRASIYIDGDHMSDGTGDRPSDTDSGKWVVGGRHE